MGKYGYSGTLWIIGFLAVLLILQPSVSPVSAASDTFVEEFSTTAFMDGVHTNASGWGSGQLELQESTLTLAGFYNPGENVWDVSIAGDIAYLATSDGLQVLNISNPENPVLITELWGTEPPSYIGRKLHRHGDILFMSNGVLHLYAINITDPSEPRVLDYFYFNSGPINDFCTSGNALYVTLGGVGVEILNITNPSDLSSLKKYTSVEYASEIVVEDRRLYLSDDRLRIFNITNSLDFVELGASYELYSCGGITVDGEIAVITGSDLSFNSIVSIINVTNPYQPTLLREMVTPNYFGNPQIDGDFLYVACQSIGIRVINMTDLLNANTIGEYNTPDFPYGLDIAGNFAFVADRGGGLQVIRIRENFDPILVASCNTPDQSFGVTVDGNYVYVADYESGLRVVNITIPSDPKNVSFYDTPSRAYDVDVDYPTAYIADGFSGLQILNVTNPREVTLLGDYDTEFARGLDVDGKIAFICDWDYGLKIVNVTNPNSPTAMGDVDTPQRATDVFVDGNFAYIADGSSGLQIVNITDLWAPYIVGSISTTGTAWDICVEGNIAYVATSGAGIRVINVTDRSSPIEIGYFYSTVLVEGIVVDGDYAYAAAATYGLRVFDVSNPRSPTLVHALDTPRQARKVFVSGDYAYVTDDTNGLQIMEVTINRCRQYNGSAQAQSSIAVDTSPATIMKATLTPIHNIPTDTNIDYFLSADSGSSWEQVQPGVEHDFSSTGEELLWRAELSTTYPARTPSIDSISIEYNTMSQAPSLLTPSDSSGTNDSTPTFSWTSVSDVTNYLLQLDTVDTFDSIELQNISVIGSTSLTPSSTLEDGLWYWRVAANDSDGDIGFFSSIRSVLIDTTSPTWDEPIQDMILELGDGFEYDVNATDDNGIDKFWVNDTTHFEIDSEGVITNSTALGVGDYPLEIGCNDTYGNHISETLTVSVEDTTSPVWIQESTDVVLECGLEEVDINFEASDL